MTAVFADSSFYIAYLNPRDAGHDRAVAAAALWVRSATTEYVLLEVANYLSHASQRSSVVKLLAALSASPLVEVVPSSGDLWDRGVELYARRPDKDWSLTDCISFVVMADRGLADALTADRHFAQAGFTPLLAD